MPGIVAPNHISFFLHPCHEANREIPGPEIPFYQHLKFYCNREFSSLKVYSWDFPGDQMVLSPSSNAGDVGSIPSQEAKIPCAAEQLSPCASAAEPERHS